MLAGLSAAALFFSGTLYCLPQIIPVQHSVPASGGSGLTHRNAPSQQFFSQEGASWGEAVPGQVK